MGKNIFDEEPFRDSPIEYKNGQWNESETYTPAPENTLRPRPSIAAKEEVQEMEQEDVDELTEQVADADEEEDYEAALNDANLRLEQGNLYKLILNHDLFSGTDADPRAVKIVQKEIRKFARESMEMMLGMRQTIPAYASGPVMQNASPFNGLEIDILKKLASAASKGATENVEEDTGPEPAKQPPKKTSLNSIGSSKPRPQTKPLQKKVEPIKRSQPKFRQELTPEEKALELDYEPLDKPIHEMTQAELDERNRQAAERQANRKSAPPPDRAPMPDYAQRHALAAAQVARATSGNAGIAALNGKLSQLVMASVSKRS